MSLIFPWALAALGMALVYIFFYCAACAARSKLDVLEERPECASWIEQLKWRATIALLHFLEPLARDWGRLQGGLTPWRSALAAESGPSEKISSWWQRLLPFRRHRQWSHPGGMGLEKNNFLENLTQLLTSRSCAVGWNPAYEDWDLQVRRGAMGEAWLHMVVEHHGGPQRLARFSIEAQPSKTILWALGTMALGAIVTGALGDLLPSATFALLLAALWAGSAREVTRLDWMLREATENIYKKLCPGSSASA
jgi:hypothetical protein